MTKKKVAPKKTLTMETESPGEIRYQAKILRIITCYTWVDLPGNFSPESAMITAEGIVETGGPSGCIWEEEDETFKVDLIEETAETVREWMK